MDPHTTAEGSFQRWRDTGDTAALGHAFDLTSRELFLIALHLSGRRDAAEDLVQATFLVAIERAAGFARGKPLLPWLCGILVREARAARRRGRRVVDAQRILRAPAAAEPIDELASREVEELVAAASDDLTPPYREVVVLRLRHGLETRAIAAALGRPNETVRTQLRRGLSQLRRRLPHSVQGALGAVSLDGFDLASIRTSTLHQATLHTEALHAEAHHAEALRAESLQTETVRPEALHAAGPTTPAMQGFAKISLAAGAIVLMSTAGFLFVPDEPPGPFGTVPSATVHGGKGSAAVAATGPAPLTRLELSHRPAAVAEPVRSAGDETADDLTTLRGRAVDARGRKPIAGATVSARDIAAAGSTAVSVTTDAHGTFELGLSTEPKVTYLVEVRAEGRVPVAAPTTLAPGSRWDFGVVSMRAAARGTGRVLDEDGRPVAGFEFTTTGQADRLIDDRRSKSRYTVTARADHTGRFRLERDVAPGSYSVRCLSAGHALASSNQVEFSTDAPAEIEVVPGQATVRARVVDRTGQPVAGVHIVGQTSTSGNLRTDDDGVVVFTQRVGGAPDVHLWLPRAQVADISTRQTSPSETARTTTRPSRSGRFAWGSEVDIVIQAGARIALEVVDPEGDPVTRFTVDGTSWQRGYGDHAGGRTDLEIERPGPVDLVVLPKDPALARSQRIRVDAGEGATIPLRIELERAVTATVSVADPRGRPVAGARVEWIDPAPDRTFAIGHRAQERAGPSRGAAYLVGKALTDASGRARALVPPNRRDLVVRVTGGGVLPLLERSVSTTRVEEVVALVASRGSTLDARLEPAELARELDLATAEREWYAYGTPSQRKHAAQMYPGVTLLDASGRALEVGGKICHPFDPRTGRLLLSGIPAGRYTVQLVFYTPGGHRVQPEGTHRAIDMRDGATARATFRPGHSVRFGSWKGRVHWQGKPLANAEVSLRRAEPSRRDWGRYPTNAEGHASAPALGPGDYELRIRLGEDHVPFVIATIRVAPGRETTQDVFGTASRIELDVTDGAGVPLANHQFILRARDLDWLRTATTDGAGRLSAEMVPPGVIHLESRAIETGNVRSDTVVPRGEAFVPRGAAEHRQAVTVR